MHHTYNTQEPGLNGRGVVALATTLREQVLSGALPAGRFLPPVRALAHSHAVATVTVNRALKLLAREGLVIAHARQGYLVRPGAADPDRGLPLAYVNSSQHEVGAGMDLFHRNLLMEFQRVAGERGWALLCLDADRMEPAEMVGRIAAANCSGILTNAIREELRTAVAAIGIPSVQVDAWRECEPCEPCDCVLQDGFMGGLQAGNHLVNQGHTRIGWIGPELAAGIPQVLERFSGAHAALLPKGLAFARQIEAPLGEPEAARKAAVALLRGKNRPTAVLALWQDMSRAVARAAAELRLSIGQDFEMVGWCTEEEYASFYVPLFPTGAAPPAVVWSIARMADAAVARLKQRRAEPELAPLFLRVPTRLRSNEQEKPSCT